MVFKMEKKKGRAEKKKSTVFESFKHERERGFMMYRFFALVIDFIIISFIYQFVVVVFGAPDIVAYIEMQDVVRGLAKDAPEVIERARLYQQAFITFLAVGASYEALFLALFGRSLGKLLFGFRVVSNNEDRSVIIGKLALVLRSVVKALSLYLLSAIPFIFLCLTTFGNAESRSGFDLFAGTKTLYTRRSNK